MGKGAAHAMHLIQEMFSYPFMQRAFIVGILVSVCAALLGPSMVLKRYAMIGEGLSHVGFGTLAVATLLHAAPLTISLPVVILAAFLLLRLKESSSLPPDAAIALISTASLAFGVMVISVSTGMNTDVCNYLFGTILGVTQKELWLTVCLSLLVMLTFLFLYHRIFSITFDEAFTRAVGCPAGISQMLLALMTALTIVLGMRTMGALLISSLLVVPALTAMQAFRSFRAVILCSTVLSLICFCTGLTVSYVCATPTGASISLLHIICFICFFAYRRIKGRM